MGFGDILNPIFSPLLNLPTLWAVILLSFLISLIITVVYKYTTNQNLMKQLKDEMKEFQREIKELKKLKSLGGDLIVDQSTYGIGRNAKALHKISINIDCAG